MVDTPRWHRLLLDGYRKMKPIALVKLSPGSMQCCEDVIAYACGKCGVVVAGVGKGAGMFSAEQAEKLAADHCGPWTCEKCFVEHDRSYQPTCRKCFDEGVAKRSAEREVELFEKAEKLLTYDGPVYSERFDRFFNDMDELVDWCNCEDVPLPDYVWPCQVTYPNLQIDGVCEMALSEHVENAIEAELVAYKELADFLAQWNAKQTSEMWEPRYDQVVIMDEPGSNLPAG